MPEQNPDPEPETASMTQPPSRALFNRTHSLDIAAAAIFIALSAILSAYLTPLLPRVPSFGIAIIDPISTIWMICFLVFGWRSGFLTLAVGSLLLFFFDPTGIGPIFKFLATLPLMVVPFLWYEASRRKGRFEGSLQQWCMPMKHFVPSMVIGWLGRVALMILCNVVVFLTLYAGFLKYATLALIGLPDVTGWEAVIWVTVLINTWQTIVDTVFPYVIAFKIVEKYGQSGALHT